MLKRRWGLGLALMMAGPAFGQSCGYEDLIVETAWEVVDTRADLPGFRPGNVGGDAGYLLTRYGGLDEAATIDLFDRLRHEGPRGFRNIDEIEAAWAITTYGIEDGFAHMGLDPVEGFLELSWWPVRRAVLLSDNGAGFFALVAQVRADPALSDRFDDYWQAGMSQYVLVIDQPDPVKIAIASHAEAAGELAFAGAILATLQDRTVYDAFIIRHGDDRMVQIAAMTPMVDQMGLTRLFAGAPFDNWPEPVSPERQANADRLGIVMLAALQMGHSDYSGTLLNLTGLEQEAAKAAGIWLELLDRDAFDPVRDPEAGWLVMRDAWLASAGVAPIARNGGALDWPSTRVRHFAGRLSETLDWVAAKDRMGPYMRGETGSLPDAPLLLADEAVDWPLWQEVAVGLRADGPEAVALTEATVPIAVELLWEAGDYQAALSLTDQLDLEEATAIRRDLMVRLDRLCAGYTVYPGQSVLLGGDHVYRFD